MNIKTTQIQCGQSKPYGDFFRIWDIVTDIKDKKAILDYCFTELYKRRVPESAEWSKNIRFGTGTKSGDADYYFAGYYKLENTATGYKFTVCEPFAD